MPWFIVNPDGKKVEAFRTHAEALHHLPEYGENFTLLFSPATKLQGMRMKRNLSQAELATLAEVSMNTLQKWEQGSKNINRAAAEDVWRLAFILECGIEDILE